MSGFRDGEIHNSQLSALHLLQTLQPTWTVLTKAEVNLERRGRLGNVLLEDILAAQLSKLNRIEQDGCFHPFSEANVRTAIERLRAPEPLGLMTLNEKTTDLLQLGTSLDQTIDGVTRGRSLRYIDWETLENNAFHAVAEFEVEKAGSHETRRPDIVLFVNGIPLAVIECKAPHVELGEGIGQIVTYQRGDEIPHLFRSVQLVLAVKPAEARYATVGTAAKFWAVWKEKEFDNAALAQLVNAPLDVAQTRRTFGDGFAEEQVPFEARRGEGRIVTEQDRLIHALCRPDRLLDLVRRFTLFDLGVKKVARYQQFFAVRKIMDRVKGERDEQGARRGGVVWHTQGSGKSLTMVMLAKALGLDRAITNRRVVLVTDRIDLDDQLRDTFKACGTDVVQAKTGSHLLDLIVRDKAAIVSTVINKFEAAIAKRDFKDESTDVFLLVDESHRGQYGEMHTRMKRVFPRACYIGFTGTPLMRAEKSTAARFGGIIDAYTIDQAVDDKAVLPLIYEGRQVAQEVNRAGIDSWFERVTRELPEQQRFDLKRRLARYSEIAQGDQTITAIAYDIAEHFTKFWKGTRWKAQFAVRSRAAAVKYYEIFKEMGTISAEVIMSAPDDRSTGDDPAEEVTEPVVRFWKTMMARYGGEESYNRQIVEGFKKREEPELLIVVSKLLTGFDAPVDTVLYIDKPLTGHNLLQAIARVNRVEEDKEYGYIVDYAGVLGDLDTAMRVYSALAEFEPNDLDVGHAIIDVQDQIARLPQAHANLVNHFKGVAKVRDEEAYEVFLADEVVRKEFYELLAEFARLLATALATANWANHPKSEAQVRIYRDDLRRYQKLRTAVRNRYREAIDFKQYEARIRKLLDTHISADAVEVVTEAVNIFDTAAFDRAVAEQTTPASKADLIASQTKRTITERMEEDPVFFKKISDLIADAIAEHRAKRLSDNDYLARIREAAEQVRRPKHDDVPAEVRADEHAVAIFNSLNNAMGGIGGPQGGNIRPVLAAAALELVSIVKSLKVVNWTENVDVQNAMRNRIDDYFFDVIRDQHGIDLAPEQIDMIVDSVLKVARARMA
ncbi:HsdR family type I site-specific deoxyribonuclease [Bradyrhizobium ontarionense]|uniref:Type I restriction enzyme endonuclease subunit n=1 Tax=Bradyrhizobium ontarionense TaxID=2898149 RepID=A0ABY3R756_9BRAD|nr:HsdR family type I site-specific deoxyribonuclease [Bradyrhizobium sp. A19]UFZ02602.1 HsdR family type I site-specific deoxyribonuclease [Bradyrhizobium sp. A19]